MFNKAIVIGGSMAGKFAAKALSTSFKEVIIIEADEGGMESLREKEFHKVIILTCY